jgi:hypothetical protein
VFASGTDETACEVKASLHIRGTAILCSRQTSHDSGTGTFHEKGRRGIMYEAESGIRLGEVCELKKERNIFRRNINNKEEGIC